MSDIIYAYTRKQAIEDGFQVEVSTIAADGGHPLPGFSHT